MTTQEVDNSMNQLEKILKKKKVGKQYKYLVKWKEFPEKNATWEKIENLFLYIDKVEEFETQIANEKKQIPQKKNEEKSAKFINIINNNIERENDEGNLIIK